MGDWPRGTVTFLFTDIEGSSRLWEQYPEAMRSTLARHDTVMREAIQSNNGIVFKTIGDAFCAAFADASEALSAALTIQLALHAESWPEPLRLQVRMALHTGIVEQRDRDYFGPPLNRVARLLCTGHGGQVLLSRVTQELTLDTPPPSVSLSSLGEHRLRDLNRPETVYQLLHPALPSPFPPLKSLNNPALPNNLPLQVTSFIGRQAEMAEVRALLATTRLLTLTGSGGCGKSRLALQVAADVLEDYPDGAWLVELASLVDAAFVPHTIASVLEVKEQAGQPLEPSLIEALASKQLLIVLDNCEHLLSACIPLVAALLRSCPDVRLLATSREALRIAGEQTYRVPSLSSPDPRQAVSIETITQYEAVWLFLERARLVKPNFTVTQQNAVALAQLCSRLDGIPLAIELAAARVRSLSVEEINNRLDRCFRLLTNGDRSALSRQQTLRATMNWSYDALNEQEQILLQRLAVFAGGWTLQAAEQVCAGERAGERIEEWEVLELLTSLVDKSLILMEEEPDGSMRFRMLETMRQYATEKLNESGERDAVQSRHGNYFLVTVVEAEPELKRKEQRRWLERLETEHDNLRLALAWYREQAENTETGLLLADALQPLWYVHGHFSEGRTHLDRALKSEGAQARTKIRANALLSASNLAFAQSDYSEARMLCEEALSIQQELNNRRGIAAALWGLGNVTCSQGNYDEAWSFNQDAMTIYRELRDKGGIASALNNLGSVAFHRGDYDTAEILYEESLVIERELGDKLRLAVSIGNLGNVAFARREYEKARVLYEEAQAINRELGNTWYMAMGNISMGAVAIAQGDYDKAHSLSAEALTMSRELGDRWGMAHSLEGLADVFLAKGNAQKAVRLWGTAEALRESIGSPIPPFGRELYDKEVAKARSSLGEPAFSSAWMEGRAMTLEQAVAYALEEAE